MSTYSTEFSLNEKVIIKPKTAGKYGIVREIILSSNGKNPSQEYGVEIINIGTYELAHFNRSQLLAIS